MGFDGLVSFLIRNLSNDTFDEINLNNNITKLVSDYILIDVSFILYTCYHQIEKEINDIIKFIYGLNCYDFNLVISELEKYLKDKDHWKENVLFLEGNSQEDIVNNFLQILTQDNNKEFYDILTTFTLKKLDNIIDTIFEKQFTKKIILFFDSIPSYSKILEQRKRRLKNYLESQNRKKLYQEYFDTLENDINSDIGIDYDYFGWLNNKFNFNKIIDSNSVFVKNLKEKIIEKENFIVDKEEYGEADYKIFKYINNQKLDGNISILSCDSDLLYQLMLQQFNYNYENKDINLRLLKFYINSDEYCQLFNGKIINNYLNEQYKKINKTKSNHNFNLDFYLILNLFGNDFLPSSLDLGPEINLSYFIKTHYETFRDYDFIGLVEYKWINNKYEKKINFDKLKKWLKCMDNKINLSKIILLRYYHVPYNLTIILTDEMNLNLSEIKDLLEKWLAYKGQDEGLEKNDIRHILSQKHNITENPIDNKILEEKLLNYLDFTDLDHLGMKNNNIRLEFGKNMYQNVYNYISKKSTITFQNRKIDLDFKHLGYDKKRTRNYLKMLVFIVKNFFNKIDKYQSTNLSIYQYMEVPSISDLIKYLSEFNGDLNDEIEKEIRREIIPRKRYFDSILHYLIITPHLLDAKYIELLKDKNFLKKLIINFDDILASIWDYHEINNFYKINPIHILNSWMDLLKKVNKQNLIEERNSLTIEY